MMGIVNSNMGSFWWLRKLHRALAPQLKLSRQPPKVYLFWFFFVALVVAGFRRSDGHPDDGDSQLEYGLFLVVLLGFPRVWS